MTTCTFFLCCKHIGGGGLRPPASGGASPLLPAPPSRKNRYVRVSRKYYQHEATCNRKSFPIFSRGGEAPPPAGGGRSPPCLYAYNTKKMYMLSEKKICLWNFFVHNFFANNDRRIKPSEPYSGPRPWQYMPSSRSSAAPFFCSFTKIILVIITIMAKIALFGSFNLNFLKILTW